MHFPTVHHDFVMKPLGPPSLFSLSVLLLFLVALFDLLLCPHSKVEESFQLQATHDLFYFGIGPALRQLWNGETEPLPYDHLQYPGGKNISIDPRFPGIDKPYLIDPRTSVVPRTFLGPIILTTLCQCVRYLCLPVLDIALHPLFVQFVARFFLLAINLSGWIRLAHSADGYSTSRTGRPVGAWLLLITASQFHIPFYASRMLPNTFAVAVILHAYSFWLDGRVELAASLVVFAAAIFRCDILLLLASLGLSWLVTRQLTIRRALVIGVLTGLVSLLVTVPLDSLLWQRPLWPEGEVFYFNTVLGKSRDWGTSPWHWYFSAALPKSMLITLLLTPLSLLRLPDVMVCLERRLRSSTGPTGAVTFGWMDTTWLPILMPALCFIVLYSNLGHKEMRFIFPALPLLNLASASSMSKLSELAKTNKDKAPTLIGRCMFYFGVICIVLTMIGSLAFVAVSKWNYPGGEALIRLSDHFHREVQRRNVSIDMVVVYVDVASAMSGVSLFGQRAVQYQFPTVTWNFVKAGYEDEHAILQDVESVTHALSESPEALVGFQVVAEVLGSPRLNLRRLSVETVPSIFVLERRDFWQS